MALPIGGLRSRLIHESLHRLVRTILEDLGWFAAGRSHLAINVVPEAVDAHREVPLNTLAISAEDTSSEDLELGSLLSADTTTYWIDFYAENEAVGTHLMGDVREALRGKHATIGRTAPVLDVWDYNLATPVVVFACSIDNVVSDRGHGFTRAFERYWFALRLDVVDDVTGDPIA